MPQFNQRFKLTRIAPTPSGFLHLGNAYSFVLTAAIAQNTGADILLRIDDLDRDRVEMPYVNDIFDTLTFLDIKWQKGPKNSKEYKDSWSQLSRLDIYSPAMQKLMQSGDIFACTCSRRQMQMPGYHCTCSNKNIPLNTSDAAWRILTDDRVLKINTFHQGALESALPAGMKNFVVRKKDSYPAYQLTSLLDDLHFGTDLIIRGDDLWPSTIAQHYLASVLDLTSFAENTFHHHKILTNEDHAKLSKSAGSTSIQYLRTQGFTPTQVYSQIGALLSPKKEISHWSDLSY